MPRTGIRWAATAFAAGLSSAAAVAEAAEVTDAGQGAFELPVADTGATGLSGLTHVGADRFLAVGDRNATLFELSIEFDRRSGHISNATIARGARLKGGRDTEALAALAPDRVLVCDEIGPAVREHRIEDGSLVRTLRLPQVFRRARLNRSLESVAIAPDDGAIWIANEEALQPDGPVSTQEQGTSVRLQRLAADGLPAGQWAYRTDPTPGGPLGGYERSGVADLLVLPGGELLALERALGNHGLRARIYSIDRTGATDTSEIARLEPGQLRYAAKTLLWEGRALGDNFEGMALGPSLEDGDRSLVLISDDGGATLPRLYALRIRIPRPDSELESEPESEPDPRGEKAAGP